MPPRIRVKLNSDGVRTLLKSSAMQAILRGHAQRIAASAGPGHDVNVGTTGTRARAEVVTDTIEAMRAEAIDRNLSRAFGSGR